jgi:hypothetical protein
MAFSGGITNVALQARALGHVVEDVANGIDAAGSQARVLALGVDAGQAGGAVGVQDTLWPAGQVGVSHVSGQTLAGRSAAELGAFGVVTARRRITGADHGLGSRSCWKRSKCRKMMSP